MASNKDPAKGPEKDPEQLIAEALRAHAVRTPLPESNTTPIAPVQQPGPEFGGAYGLLSGTDAWTPMQAAPDQTTTVHPIPGATTKIKQRQPIGAVWILLFAVVLGLAAGAVIGLATLL